MKDDLRKVFEELTEAPHPGLHNQLQANLASGRRPVRRELSPIFPALAALALVIGIGIPLLLLTGRPAGIPTGPAATLPSPTATVQPTPSPSAPPSPLPSPTVDASLPPFQCSAQSGGTAPQFPVTAIDIRLNNGAAGYARFVIQTNAAVPVWEVVPQATTDFILDPSGRTVTLAGSRGILIRVHGAGPQSNGGWQKDYTEPSGTIREARELGNFEAVLSFGLGVDASGCFRAFTLTGPDRLVIDVQSP